MCVCVCDHDSNERKRSVHGVCVCVCGVLPVVLMTDFAECVKSCYVPCVRPVGLLAQSLLVDLSVCYIAEKQVDVIAGLVNFFCFLHQLHTRYNFIFWTSVLCVKVTCRKEQLSVIILCV